MCSNICGCEIFTARKLVCVGRLHNDPGSSRVMCVSAPCPGGNSDAREVTGSSGSRALHSERPPTSPGDTRTMLFGAALFVLSTTLQQPPRARRVEHVATAEAPPIAKGPGDVIKTTVNNFCTVGGCGFVFTAFSESSKRAGTGGKARDAVRYFVVRNSLLQAQRWGRVSAGFAGGRALGQALRGQDDSTCAMIGSVFGGIAAAPSVAQMPSSVATFAAFGYFIDSFSSGNKPVSGEQASKRLAAARAQRLRLQQQLKEVDKTIGELQEAV